MILPTDFAPPPGLRELLPLAGAASVVPSVSTGLYGHVDGVSSSFVPSRPGDELLFLTADAYSFSPPFGQTPLALCGPPVVGRLRRLLRGFGRDPGRLLDRDGG